MSKVINKLDQPLTIDPQTEGLDALNLGPKETVTGVSDAYVNCADMRDKKALDYVAIASEEEAPSEKLAIKHSR